MKRYISFFFCFLFCFALYPGSAVRAGEDKAKGKLRQIAQFEGGTLFQNGAVKVVELKGTYRQMGRQYGFLMRNDLRDVYKLILEEYAGRQKFSNERLKTIADAFYNIYPMRYRELFSGIAETSGLTPEQIRIINAVEFFPKINHLEYNCSALAVWNDYTKDGSVVFGRNNDDAPFFKIFGSYVSIAVLKPDDGSLPTAIVNYTGAIYAANGMNSKGVFLELNGGPWEGFYLNRPSIFVSLMSYLQDLPSIELINEAIMAEKANMSSIVTIADGKRAYSVECSCSTARIMDGGHEAIVAAANHFADPAWGLSQLDDKKGGDTMKRRANLLALGKKFKGQFDAAKMMEVFDTTIENGGATSPYGTIFQIVAVPGKYVMWIKAPGTFDWTEADLSKILK
ncbi:MAG: C45 family autoproteolytic acyltransferase/hydrolase [Firmicutes bacterium]|nr:C45 family autoproteolytic acyltransferase/hydrolase [Bacillota bacterium]